jgi:hypothetical protein
MKAKQIQAGNLFGKRSFIAFCFFAVGSVALNAQTWLGAEGSFGLSYNGGEPINAIQLSGRLHVNDYLSSNLGIGLWNTGLKETWKDMSGDAQTFTLKRLREGKAIPTLHWGLRGEMPLLKVKRLPISLFVEPSLIFLPFSSKTPTIEEVYYTLDPIETANQGTNVYKPTGSSQLFTLQTTNNPKLYYGVQLGVSTELKNQMYLGLGVGYSNLDLFNSLRNQTLHGVSLNDHLPRKGLTTVSLTLSYSVQAK